MMITEWYTTSSWHCKASAKVENARAAFSMNEFLGSSTLVCAFGTFITFYDFQIGIQIE